MLADGVYATRNKVWYVLRLRQSRSTPQLAPDLTKLSRCINEGVRLRANILVAIFCGLRASELRGLRWADIDFEAKQLNLTQRADASHRIGNLKSRAAYRSIPCRPIVINALREWKLVYPKPDTGKKDAAGKPIEVLELAFPNGLGKVEGHSNVLERGLEPALIAAGLAESRQVRILPGSPLPRRSFRNFDFIVVSVGILGL